MTRKLPHDAFYAQFHNHERHLDAQDHERPFSHEVQDHPAAGPNPDYSRKKKHNRKPAAVQKALHITVGR
jgi:hypothetical protein